MEVGQVSYSFACVDERCHAARGYGAGKIARDMGAVKHRKRFPHHKVALIESRVTHVFGEATSEIECAVCSCRITACDANGCGGRRYPGWRATEDTPPF